MAIISFNNWKGNEAKQFVRNNASDNLEIAAIFLKNTIKENISTGSPPPSDPGQPPNKDTGRLRASISHEVDKKELIARVGTNVIYAKFLEAGTVKMAPRPFLVPAFNENIDKLKQLMKGTK